MTKSRSNLRRPILIFLFVSLFLVGGALWFVQTPTFAGMAKKVLVRFIPGDPGVAGDFDDFSINLLPPGVAVNAPRVRAKRNNIFGLPEGTSVSARKIILSFQPFQMLSGRISVDRVIIDRGRIEVSIEGTDPSRSRSKGRFTGVQWSDLLNVRAEEIEFRDTEVLLAVGKPAARFEFTAERFRLSRESRGSRLVPAFFGGGEERTVYGLEVALSRLSVGWGSPAQELEGFRSVRLSGEIAPERIEFRDFSFERNGLVASGNGSIEGDLLDPNGERLQLAADLRLSGDLSRWGDILLLSGMPAAGRPKAERNSSRPFELAGSFESQVRLDGNLLDWQRSAAARVRLQASTLRFGAWGIERLEAEGSWRARSGELGEVEVKAARASSAAKPRFGGRAPGAGGTVELGAFRFRPGSRDSFRVPVRFSGAHLHWLAAPLVKELWPLEARVDGSADVEVRPRSGSNWEVAAGIDVSIPKLVLDNQRQGFDRPLSTVLDIASISLKGPVRVDRTGVRVEAVQLKLPRSSSMLTGEVRFGERPSDEVEFDLSLDADLDLADIGTLSGSAIRGKGPFDIHVHGPASRVLMDFFPEVEGTEYLGLEFGRFAGKITLDEHPALIRFDGIRAKKGTVSYSLDGTVHFGDPDSIDLKSVVDGGDMQDFLSVFHRLTDDVWWFPHSLAGGVSGTIRVFGGLDLDLLSVTGDLDGTDWRFLGERFRRVTLQGGYDRGRYYFDTFRALKKNGRLSASVSYLEPPQPSGAGNIEWDFSSDGLTLGDLTWIAGLDVPLRGDISIRSRGNGRMGLVDSQSVLELTHGSIRGQSVADSRVQLHTSKGRMDAEGRIFGNQGRLRWKSEERGTGASSLLELEANSLDFSGILLVLNPSLVQDRALRGTLTGNARFAVQDGKIERMEGDLVLQKFLAAKTGAQLELKSPVSMGWHEGTSSAGLFRFDSPGAGGAFELRLETRSGRIDGEFGGSANLALLEFVNPVVQKAKGLARVSGAIAGSLGKPALTAKAKLENAGPIQVRGLDTSFDRISGEFDYSDLRITIPRLDADLGGGAVSGGGTIELFVDRVPRLSLAAQLSGARLKIWPFQFVKVNGRMEVAGSRLPYLVSGKFTVDEAFSNESFSASRASRGSTGGAKSSRFAPPVWAGGVLEEPLFALDFDAAADRGILFQNELIDAEMKGRIHVGNTLEDPQITGRAQIVQGRAIFKDRIFQILSSDVDFDTPATFDPKFSMLASIELPAARVQLGISGRPSNYRVDLTSNPMMSESEIISLLALGVTRDELSRFRSDRSNVDRTEAASLVLHSTDFNRDLEKKTGFQLQIDEAVDSTQGTSIFRPNQGADSASAPKIVVKRRIGERVDVSYGSTVGVGTNSQQAVNAEFKVSPGVSVIGVWDTTEGTGADAQSRDSFGLDLKVQKRFK